MDARYRKSIVPGPVILLVVVLLIISLVAGSAFYHYVEGLSLVDSFYFSSMTLTTVGYGDFVPKTDLGKIFTAVYAFVGIGVFLGFAAVVFETALGRIHQIQKNFKDQHKDQ